MLRTDFHRGHRGLARGEMLSPSRLFLVPSFPISSILPEGAALPSVAVLERRYGGKVLLNSHNVQPLFQICKKTAQRVTVESVREENNTERRTLAFLRPFDDDDDRLLDLGGLPGDGDGVLPVSSPTAAAAALGDEPETTGMDWASGRIRSDASCKGFRRPETTSARSFDLICIEFCCCSIRDKYSPPRRSVLWLLQK